MRRAKIFVGLFAAVATIACSERALIEEAKEAVAYDLIDPDAAKFREVRAVDEYTVCGEVNGVNRLGAYTGYNDFYATVIGDYVNAQIIDPNDEIGYQVYRQSWLEKCGTEIDQEIERDAEETIGDIEAEADAIIREMEEAEAGVPD